MRWLIGLLATRRRIAHLAALRRAVGIDALALGRRRTPMAIRRG